MTRLCPSFSTILAQKRLLSLSFRCLAKEDDSSSSGTSKNSSEVTNLIISQKLGEDSVNVLKIVQRFRKQPNEWPLEEQPFAIVEKKFLGKIMHPVELRPERGFVNMVPFGFMMLRHFFRKFRAKGNYDLFQSTGIFDEKEVRAGTKRVFEVISQHAFKNKLADLVAKNFCGEDLVRRFEAAGSSMSEKQRELFNLTEQDVYAIAPGVLGPFQLIRPMLRNGAPHITYSLLSCAFYKKQMLFDAVKDVPLIENGDKADYLPMPTGYGYAAPRLVFAFITFGNKIVSRGEVENDVQLLEFQYLPTDMCLVQARRTESFPISTVWQKNRAPLRTQNRYPPDQKAFSLTRDATETISKYQNTRLFVLGAEPCLNMTSDDLIQGGRKVFRIILDAVLGRKVESLAPLVMGNSVLDVHRKQVWDLKDKQRSALMVTDADFVGLNGFVYNWDGFGSEKVALLRKNELYKLARQLPFNLEKERLLLRMPYDYGFITPRYVVMRIDMCHQSGQNG
ncbi:hypothetical protein OSTOST_14562, partial [Ostertagia ostertagi]